MKLARMPQLDALCGEYLLGTLRGRVRHRFERALREEPLVSLRLRHWQGLFQVRFTTMMEAEPPRGGFQRLQRELKLEQYREPLLHRLSFWRNWALAATLAALAVLSLQVLRTGPDRESLNQIAQLESKSDTSRVTASVSRDGRILGLHSTRPIVAGPAQSYELWLLPANGAAPISLAVLGQLEGRLEVPAAHIGQIKGGAKLAISVEPAGGSPTGAPTGPVILVGNVVS